MFRRRADRIPNEFKKVPDPWHAERARVWHHIGAWEISISHVSLGECPFLYGQLVRPVLFLSE
jgi:hypothetical protein